MITFYQINITQLIRCLSNVLDAALFLRSMTAQCSLASLSSSRPAQNFFCTASIVVAAYHLYRVDDLEINVLSCIQGHYHHPKFEAQY